MDSVFRPISKEKTFAERSPNKPAIPAIGLTNEAIKNRNQTILFVEKNKIACVFKIDSIHQKGCLIL